MVMPRRFEHRFAKPPIEQCLKYVSRRLSSGYHGDSRTALPSLYCTFDRSINAGASFSPAKC